MDNQSQPPSLPPPSEVLVPYGKSRIRNLSILVGLIALLVGLTALWIVSYEPKTPTQYGPATKTVETAGNTSAPEQESTQSDPQSSPDVVGKLLQAFRHPAPEQKSTQSDTLSVAPEEKSTQSETQSARADTERPLGSTKNDFETKMCRVADRDFYHLSGITVSRGQESVPDSEQVPVDDKLTAEEVLAAGEKYPSVRFKLDVPISGIRFYDGLHLTVRRQQPVIDAQKLSQSERVRLCGLRRIQRMAALTLYNNHCGDRPRDDKAAAATIIESQFKKLPKDIQEKTLDYQVKAVEARSRTLLDPRGWRQFCDGVNNDIKKGYADSMFKTAREGFFPIEEN